jgi:riboflavin kinase/FMN adenylyltransferase
MQHHWSLDDVNIQNAWLTIGSFDGVHRGHQEIIRSLTKGAHSVGAPAVVLTFHPHPAAVLGKRKDVLYLTDPDQRAELLGDLGVDEVITLAFTPTIAGMLATEFLTLVNDHLHLQELWVGYDFALGKGREGNVDRLRQLSGVFGFNLEVVQPFLLDGEVVSSSRIRSLLADGNVHEAARLLGRPYQLGGRVVPGDGRGRSIGIPTANLSVWPAQQLPKAGAYVCRAQVNGQWLGALTNVGMRPTFEPQPVAPRVEAHLLDFHAELYGQIIRLEFLEWLRPEEKYPNVQALLDQMQLDISKGRALLASLGDHPLYIG